METFRSIPKYVEIHTYTQIGVHREGSRIVWRNNFVSFKMSEIHISPFNYQFGLDLFHYYS
jgi:hypothetical protein